MSRKTLLDFAELHAPAAMRRWREAYEDCVLREMRGEEPDPINPEDPGEVATQAEVEIETALAAVLKEGRYAIEGRRNGTVERLQPYSMNRLRLALGTGGMIEIDHEGRTANAWSDCDVIDEGAMRDDTQPARRAPKPGVGNTPFNSDIALVARGLAGLRTGEYKSALAAAKALAPEIQGNSTEESKVKRLADKIRRDDPLR